MGRLSLDWLWLRSQSCLEFVGQGFIIFICIDIIICYPAGERAAGVGCFPVRSLA